MKAKIFRTKPVKNEEFEKINYSQAKIKGFSIDRYSKTKILLIGAGAIGSNLAWGAVRKGIGHISIFDDDYVELKNLPRQLFSLKDARKKRNKAICLAKFLSEQGFFKTEIEAYPYRFQEALEYEADFRGFDVVICAVDNNPTRMSVAEYCIKNKIPLIMSSISRDGNQMCCSIQEPEKACYGCMMPSAINDDTYPCNLPGIIDINQVVAGVTLFALDSIVMARYREWNFKMAFLDGSIPDYSGIINKKSDCKLCGGDKWTHSI